MRRRSGLLGIAAAALLVAGSGCSPIEPVPGMAVVSPQPLPTLEAYLAQQVEWQSCREDPELDCGSIRVPVDYERPSGLAITMPLVRLRATDPTHRLGVLTTNPGGPGESGYEQVVLARNPHNTSLRKFLARYDLVGFDPRGVGHTAGVRCLGDREMDEYLATDFTPTDTAGLHAVAAAHKRYAAACLHQTGTLLGFVGTEFVARDMDIMRSALGEDTLNFIGFSYGTRIGLQYAEQFPHRVGRMLLDSVDDPSVRTERWDFSSTEPESSAKPVELAPHDRVVRDMLTSCVARPDCPVGTDAEAAMRTLLELIDHIDAHPIPAADGRKVGSNLALIGIFQATYDERYWPSFEKAFAQALDGDGTGFAQLADSYVGRSDPGTYSTSDPAFWAVQCVNDDPATYRSKSENEILAELARIARNRTAAAPIFGANRVFSTPLCLFWPVPPTRQSTAVDAAGAPTIVLLNNTEDPATKLEGAQNVARNLADAVLVVNEHEGHIAFDNGSECIDAIVVGFFLDGIVPEKGTYCPG
ncbi:alpha/beta hydrolase [Nocardia sp. NPDC051463]|uniref:alpha/beta hydrolase n=1 Tax=Nocardia sp. NPDC051463 TaxID=3154845 RepID=UPI003439913C